MPGIYRDGLGNLSARLRQLQGEISRCEATINPWFWEVQPSEVREAFHQLPPMQPLDEVNPQTMIHGVEVCQAYLSHLQFVQRNAALLATRLTHVPETAPQHVPPLESLLGNELVKGHTEGGVTVPRSQFDEALPAYLKVLNHVDSRLYFERQSSDFEERATVWLRFQTAPVVVILQWLLVPSTKSQSSGDLWATAGTSMPIATPTLNLRPQGYWDGVKKFLGALKEVEVGIPLFDEYFIIQGDPMEASALLSQDVRRALLSLAQFDVPTVSTGSGLAWLRWHYSAIPEAFLWGFQSLVALRRIPIEVKILRSV